MAISLPYLSSPGTVDSLLKRLKEAAKPERFTTDFVTTVLQFKGGTGASIPAFLKKLGILNSDATPSLVYDRLRNNATAGVALAEAIRSGFRPLYQVNEYAHKLSESELRGLIVQVTGLEKDHRVVELIHGTIKRLLKHADFAAPGAPMIEEQLNPAPLVLREERDRATRPIGLSYTINLNLPATTNIEVFNAIFKSLRDHLLND